MPISTSTAPGHAILAILGSVFTAIGLLVTAIFLAVGGTPWTDARLDDEGQATHGQVTDVVYDDNKIVDDAHPWRIEYSYEVRGKEFHGRVETLDQRLARAAETTGVVRVLYLPDDPTTSKLEGTEYSLFGWLTIFPAIFALAGFAILMLGLVLRKNARVKTTAT